MTFNELLKSVQNGEFARLTFDSREVTEGTLFVCKGVHFDVRFLLEAVQKGACCAVSETDYSKELQAAAEAGTIAHTVPVAVVKNIRTAMADLANAFYGEPWKRLHTVGVTGTKGKSTVVYYIRAILDDYLAARGKKLSGLLSGIDNFDGETSEESHLTTPEALLLQKHMATAVKNGLEYLEMEVSSQALKYDRVRGVHYQVGCFLNIGTDHISTVEHRDFADYYASKLRLFDQTCTAVVNCDDSHAAETLARAAVCETVIGFGCKQERHPGCSAYLYGHHVQKTTGGVTFEATWVSGAFEETTAIELTMPGLFNVENALAAMACCYALQIPAAYMVSGLKKARVPGRMEPFRTPAGNVVLVDYAHNQMSFEKLYGSTREEYPQGYILGIYGCPGKKAQARRSELAREAAKYGNELFITEEDAGEEDLTSICREIAVYAQEAGIRCRIEEDREKAIETAICEAEERTKKTGRQTIVLLTGKGRETRQKRGIEYVPVPSDVAIVRQVLENLNGKAR